MPRPPLLIAHRGASADRPEHTLAAYRLAIEQGADVIEPDLVSTRDGHLVARHENEISGTTDVMLHREFAERRTVKMIDGERIEGWFTEDFTLAELKTLKARERIPLLRSKNRRFDDRESIPTLAEILALLRAEEQRLGRRIGLYPETKHPSHFRALGLPLEPPLLEALHGAGYRRADPVFIQSFETGNLLALRPQTDLRLVQLLDSKGAPPDRPGTPFAELASAEGLRRIAGYADGVGVAKAMVIPRGPDERLGQPTALVGDAHAAGLLVHVWTFRPENAFLPAEYRRGILPMRRGDAEGEMRAFLGLGIDGLFSDSTADAFRALQAFLRAFPPAPARGRSED